MTAVVPQVDQPVFLDVDSVREDFPILKEHVHGKPLIYFDNGATSQKPIPVIEAMHRYYLQENSNIHRGVHLLSTQATIAYEQARSKVKSFINAGSENEVVFVRGTTEAINLVAQTYGRQNVKSGDEIILTAMEHHSNIVPWQLLAKQNGATIKVVPMTDQGELIIDEYEKMFTPRTRLVAVVHVSNSLGTVNPVHHMVEIAHRHGVPVLVDGAQAVQHMPVDMRAMQCDFYAFSAHKMYGPTGVGILYGREELLQDMPPYQGGGDMIRSVSFEETTFNELPYKFEAGTPNISGGIAFDATIDYVNQIGMHRIMAYENALMRYATESLLNIPGLRIIGTAKTKASVISFVLDGVHPHDVGTFLDLEGIAIRTGHHCTQPVMTFFGIPATSRVSLALYNKKEEIDVLVEALHKVRKTFG
ncbi:MAG: cysteine desulfurase [Bacteroidetes bacterium]|nr:cysteine desulfurase [Bacteroidota bacterium]